MNRYKDITSKKINQDTYCFQSIRIIRYYYTTFNEERVLEEYVIFIRICDRDGRLTKRYNILRRIARRKKIH